MADLYEVFGIDASEVEWEALGLCLPMDGDDFFDHYEEDSTLAVTIDDICLSCPVLQQCLEYAVEHKLTGVWGGVYLTKGKTDPDRNKHKTPAVWKKIKEKINA